MAWLNGLYVHEALMSVYKAFNPMVKKESPEYHYPSEPIKPKKPLTTAQERRLKATTEMIEKHNQEIREKLGR